MGVEGQGLGPGQQIGGERDDLDPEPVLGVAVEGQVPQPGVLQGADAVVAAGALAVPDLECGQRPAGSLGVGGEAGDAPAVVVGQPQLGAGMQALAAAIARVPAGMLGPNRADKRVGLVRVGIQPVSSATSAPSRGSPSPSTAARQACSGMVSIAALHAFAGGEADGVLQPQVRDVVQERLGAGAGVGTDQHLTVLVLGKLG